MELLRILPTEIPRASPARQREQTATGAVAHPYREDSPLRVKSADGGRSGFGADATTGVTPVVDG